LNQKVENATLKILSKRNHIERAVIDFQRRLEFLVTPLRHDLYKPVGVAFIITFNLIKDKPCVDAKKVSSNFQTTLSVFTKTRAKLTGILGMHFNAFEVLV